MKLEKSFTIEGHIVDKIFQKGEISVYQYGNDFEMELYFVNNKTDVVMFKQEIGADCNQNTGFISIMNFVGVN